MITHSVTVQGRVIGYPHNERVISRNVQVDAIAATFDSEWAATTNVLAVFTNGQTVVRVDAGYKSGKATVTVPWEVLADDGMLYVSFVGYLPGKAVFPGASTMPGASTIIDEIGAWTAFAL